MMRRTAPVILKNHEVSVRGTEVLIRPPRGLPGGPTVMLRTDDAGRSVLDVTCPCGRRFDLVLEEEE